METHSFRRLQMGFVQAKIAFTKYAYGPTTGIDWFLAADSEWTTTCKLGLKFDEIVEIEQYRIKNCHRVEIILVNNRAKNICFSGQKNNIEAVAQVFFWDGILLTVAKDDSIRTKTKGKKKPELELEAAPIPAPEEEIVLLTIPEIKKLRRDFQFRMEQERQKDRRYKDGTYAPENKRKFFGHL